MDSGLLYRTAFVYRDGGRLQVRDDEFGPILTNPSLNAIADFVGGCLFGTLGGALVARKVAFDPATFRAKVTAEMTGPDYFARISGIVVEYDLSVPPPQYAAAERALRVHPRGCSAHRQFANQIPITWRARLRHGDQTTHLTEDGPVATAIPADSRAE